MLALVAGVTAASPGLVFEGGDGLGKGQHIVFVTGEEFDRSEEGMSMFAKILSRHHGFKCTVLFAIDPKSGFINPNQTGNIPGLDALKNADLMVIFARFRELPDKDMKHIAALFGRRLQEFRSGFPHRRPGEHRSADGVL